ncbi:hypothetical protein ACQ4PT_044148 [Festuca glaucescens]
MAGCSLSDIGKSRKRKSTAAVTSMEPAYGSPCGSAAAQTVDDHSIRIKRQQSDVAQIDQTAMKDGEITVRASLHEASKFMSETVKPAQKKVLREHGCGFMLDFHVGPYLSKRMMVWLYNRFVEDTLTIDLGSGEQLHITEHVVHVIYGFPKEKDGEVPSPSGERDTSAVSWLKENLEGVTKQHPVASDLYGHVSKGGTDDFTMKLIILVFFMKTTCATSNARIGSEAGLVMNMDFKKLKDMNLCGLVLNELKQALTKFRAKEGKKNVAEGPAVLPLLYYLDTRAHKSVDSTTIIPRVSQLDASKLKKISIDDWNDITNKFGKLRPRVLSEMMHYCETHFDGHMAGHQLTMISPESSHHRPASVDAVERKFTDTIKLLEDAVYMDQYMLRTRHVAPGDTNYDSMVLEAKKSLVSSISDLKTVIMDVVSRANRIAQELGSPELCVTANHFSAETHTVAMNSAHTDPRSIDAAQAFDMTIHTSVPQSRPTLWTNNIEICDGDGGSQGGQYRIQTAGTTPITEIVAGDHPAPGDVVHTVCAEEPCKGDATITSSTSDKMSVDGSADAVQDTPDYVREPEAMSGHKTTQEVTSTMESKVPDPYLPCTGGQEENIDNNVVITQTVRTTSSHDVATHIIPSCPVQYLSDRYTQNTSPMCEENVCIGTMGTIGPHDGGSPGQRCIDEKSEYTDQHGSHKRQSVLHTDCTAVAEDGGITHSRSPDDQEYMNEFSTGSSRRYGIQHDPDSWLSPSDGVLPHGDEASVCPSGYDTTTGTCSMLVSDTGRVAELSEFDSSINPSGCNATSETTVIMPQNTCTPSPCRVQPVDGVLSQYVCSDKETQCLDIILPGCCGRVDAHAAEGTNSMMLTVADGEPPSCNIDQPNTLENDCSSQYGGPPVQPTFQPMSHYDETGMTHETNDCDMVCAMDAPVMCHTADTTQPTSHELIVCDGTSRPDATVYDEFNVTGNCDEHASIHDIMPDAGTSLSREEKAYASDVQKDKEAFASEQNNTSTG